MVFIEIKDEKQKHLVTLNGKNIGEVWLINEPFGKWQAGITTAYSLFYGAGFGETQEEAVENAINNGLKSYRKGVEFFESLAKDINQ